MACRLDEEDDTKIKLSALESQLDWASLVLIGHELQEMVMDPTSSPKELSLETLNRQLATRKEEDTLTTNAERENGIVDSIRYRLATRILDQLVKAF